MRLQFDDDPGRGRFSLVVENELESRPLHAERKF